MRQSNIQRNCSYYNLINKSCQNLEFDPDNVGLVNGMYIPLDYLKLLQEDKCIEGERNGKSISYENVGRYFDNSAFKTIIEGGWIGTNHGQSEVLVKIISNTLENGRSAVLAVKNKISKTPVPQISFDQKK